MARYKVFVVKEWFKKLEDTVGGLETSSNLEDSLRHRYTGGTWYLESG